MRPETRAAIDIADPLERAKATNRLIDELQEDLAALATARRDAIAEMKDGQRKTQATIAVELGLTPGRVSQILKGHRPPAERAFLGSGMLTVAVAGKVESNRPDPQPVVAQDDLVAYERLAEFVRTLGLDIRYEVIPPPGNVLLNRENLIVACGPRHSPIIAQVLESDAALSFVKDGNWKLVDHVTGHVYPSPMDDGQSSDVGYLARLPRPDGRGTFLYAAGIHAAGEAGVVHYVINNMADLYGEVRLRRFSTLIECDFDPATREVVGSRRLTPLYRPDGS